MRRTFKIQKTAIAKYEPISVEAKNAQEAILQAEKEELPISAIEYPYYEVLEKTYDELVDAYEKNKDQLTKDEIYVITHRYDLENKTKRLSLRDLEDDLGLSRQSISHLEKQAMAKLGLIREQGETERDCSGFITIKDRGVVVVPTDSPFPKQRKKSKRQKKELENAKSRN